MSTIYDFDEKNAFESIRTHYSNDGFDFSGTETADSYIEEIDGEFNDNCIEIVKDVFVGDNNTFIVVQFDDKWGTHIFYILEMSTSQFKSEWSEKVWAKFREDNYVVCPLCGEKKAEFKSGATYSERLEQFYCYNCNEAYILNGYGKFMRKGTLSEPIYARDYW